MVALIFIFYKHENEKQAKPKKSNKSEKVVSIETDVGGQLDRMERMLDEIFGWRDP